MFHKSVQILGIALGGRRAAAFLMERSGGEMRKLKSCAFSMSLDLLKDAPELVGRELRGHLDEAGISCRRCIVCVPAKWLFTTQVELPELSEEDAASFLELQAEKNLPLPVADLVLGTSRFCTSDSVTGVNILALPASHLQRLLGALSSARLRPLGVTTAIAAVAKERAGQGTVVLSLGQQNLELAVGAGGGVACLRSLDEVLEEDGGQTRLHCETLLREVRITLSRLPEQLRSALRAVEIYGSGERTALVAEDLRAHLSDLGLCVETVESPGNVPPLSGDQSWALAPALPAATARHLRGERFEPDFLPVRPSRFEKLTSPILKRRMASLLCAAAAVVVVTLGALWLQGRRLARLEEEWENLAPVAEDARLLQEKIRAYRGWFDDSSPTLAAAAELTEAFPEEGSVWLRSLTIKDRSRISCSGSAARNDAWLGVLDALRSTPGVGELQVSQVRGDSPLEFSFSYLWEGGRIND